MDSAIVHYTTGYLDVGTVVLVASNYALFQGPGCAPAQISRAPAGARADTVADERC
jgi:hypothetical protein